MRYEQEQRFLRAGMVMAEPDKDSGKGGGMGRMDRIDPASDDAGRGEEIPEERRNPGGGGVAKHDLSEEARDPGRTPHPPASDPDPGRSGPLSPDRPGEKGQERMGAPRELPDELRRKGPDSPRETSGGRHVDDDPPV